MFLKTFFKQTPWLGGNGRGNGLEKELADFEKRQLALFRIGSMIEEKQALDRILEVIAQESLHCLDAHRSSLFIVDETTGILKTETTFAQDAVSERVGLYEEKEVARKAFKEKKSFLLRDPEDFAGFFNYEKRERKIISLLSVPIYSITPARVQSVVRFEGSSRFREKDLQNFMMFTNHASVAMQMPSMNTEIDGNINFRKDYERHLDRIIEQLKNLVKKEERFESSTKGPAFKTRIENKGPDGGGPVCGGALLPAEDISKRLGQEEKVEVGSRGSDYESLCFDKDFKSGGLFIRTPNPMEVGEKIFLNLRIPDGQEPIEVNCKVVWTNQYGNETKYLHRGMGVKLLDNSPGTRKRIEKYFLLNENKELSNKYWHTSIVNG